MGPHDVDDNRRARPPQVRTASADTSGQWPKYGSKYELRAPGGGVPAQSDELEVLEVLEVRESVR